MASSSRRVVVCSSRGRCDGAPIYRLHGRVFPCSAARLPRGSPYVAGGGRLLPRPKPRTSCLASIWSRRGSSHEAGTRQRLAGVGTAPPLMRLGRRTRRVRSAFQPTTHPSSAVLDAHCAPDLPCDLMEVVIADDGSDRPPSPRRAGIHSPVSIVRLERTLAFGAGRVRTRRLAGRPATCWCSLMPTLVLSAKSYRVYARWFVDRPDVMAGYLPVRRHGGSDGRRFGYLVAEDALALISRAGGRQSGVARNPCAETDDLRIEAVDAFRIVTVRLRDNGPPQYGRRSVP